MFTRRAVIAAAISGAALAGWWQWPAIHHVWRRATGPVVEPVVVVLPLASGDPAGAPYARGFTQDLIAALGRTPGVTMAGRSGMERLEGRALEYIAREMNVSAMVTGSLRRETGGLALTLRLIATSDGEAVWSNDFSASGAEAAGLAASAAQEIASVLGVGNRPPGEPTRKPRRIDPSAYELYLRGLDAMNRLQPAAAAALFEQAAADGQFAQADAGLALALHDVGRDEGIPDDPDRLARARAAADRALQQNPELPEAHLAKGLVSPSLDAALASLARAVELDAAHAPALEALGDLVLDFDPERAIAFYGRALAADPFRETSRVNQATALLLLNRWGLARAELLRTAWEHAPAWSQRMFPVLDIEQGKLGAAFADLARIPGVHDRPFFMALETAALAAAGKRDEALAGAAALHERFPDFCEGRVLRAGLTLDRGDAAGARSLAAPLLEAAGADAARGSALRCATAAAAALGDGELAAALLQRVVEREDALRTWSAPRFGQTGRGALMGRFYPWTKIVDLPPMVQARHRMDAALARAHDLIAARLGPIAYK
ncbi:MAG: hypothetical protein IT176_03355 [Acidobacteria bacterium]|nr:hypothetical protein [Acidobacteriota bacterium]